MSQSPLKLVGFEQDIWVQSATQLEDLDTVRILRDGRMFAYALAGEALAAGKVNQGAVADAHLNNDAVAANAAIGALTVTLTPGADDITASIYKDGYFHINAGGTPGQMYRVKDNTASSTTFDVELKDPLRVAITSAASKFTLTQNRQYGVITAVAAGLTAPVTGVSPIAVTSGYYFWNQVKGPCAVLIAGTAVVGNGIAVLTTNGAGAPLATDSLLPTVGVVMAVNATTEYSLISLAIPGY